MKRFNDMNKTFKLALLGSALALAAGPASAEVYHLCAGVTSIDLPDGSAVPMWGYAQDDNGNVGDGCGTGVVKIPGPELEVTDGTLTINLRNDLPEPTSIVIPSLPMPDSGAAGPGGNGPTWDDGATGARNPASDPPQRVRSFGAEAASGATESYSWSSVRPGTFLYHSGTHPQKQVYMGLSGAVTQDAVAAAPPALAEAYPGVPYAQDIVLFYSEIDPVLNAAVNELYNPTGLVTPYSTSIDYHAQWFLVNGEPYSTNCTPDGNTPPSDVASGYPCSNMAQTPDISVGVAKTPTLLRFLSTAGETHVPTLQGLHMTIHAEDGNQYNWQEGATVMGTAPREQYSVMLPPLKTKDAIIEPQLDGTYALYDGNGYMTNPTNPDDFDHGDPVGGMLRFLSVAQDGAVNEPPIGGPDFATVVEGGTITIDVLANDSDPEGQPLTIAANSTPTAGTVVCDTGIVGGTCEYTAAAGAGSPTFTYDVSDGVKTTTGVLVTVTVEENVAPIGNPDSATTDTATPVTVNVLANDTGQPGETLTIANFAAVSANGATVSCDTATGDCTYTPNGVFVSPPDDTFTYDVSDGVNITTNVQVSITVDAVPGNAPPVANDDVYNVIEDGILSIAAPGVLENDTDADNVPPANPWDGLTVTLVSGPTNAVGFNLLATGAFFYQPDPGYHGGDSFVYEVSDGNVDGTDQATVTITVDPGNDIPTANDDTFFLKSMYDTEQLTTEVAPGVLANDTDVDGDPLTAVLDTDVSEDATLALNTNGSFTYTTGNIDNIALGSVDTFTYFANDGNVNSAAPATVDLVRKLTVVQAVCERRNNGRCDWRIEGDKLEAGGRVEAWFGATRIGRTGGNTGAGPWTISVNNSQVNLGTGPIDVRVDTDGDAEILAYPTTAAQ